MKSYRQYSTPRPSALFSTGYFQGLTVSDAQIIQEHHQYPTILPSRSITEWSFGSLIPADKADICLSVGEPIPNLEDLLPITRTMEAAYDKAGARCIHLILEGYDEVCYHFSKARCSPVTIERLTDLSIGRFG